jgi:hypothetical protein
MSKWIAFTQYPGFEILDDGSKIKTPKGEAVLTPGKYFLFVHPLTGTKMSAKPDVLLARALRATPPVEVKAVTPGSTPTRTKKVKALSETQLARQAAREAKAVAKAAREKARIDREKAKADKAKKREQRKANLEEKRIRTAKKQKQLLPDSCADEIRMAMHSQIRKEGGNKDERGISGRMFYFHKDERVVEILSNTEKNLVLIRIEGPADWRADRFFYNPDTEKYLRFDEPVHKPGYGNAAVIWPDNLDGEHLLGEKHNELRLKREMARLKAKADKNEGLANMAEKAKENEVIAEAEAANGGKKLSYYQKQKAKKIAERLGLKSLDEVQVAREAMGLD